MTISSAIPTESTCPDRAHALHIIIVGGGLAGMAAAVALEEAGAWVTLIESRKSLGGRASSFEDPQTGETLDNCQHVLLGCCTNLLDFYRRIGVENHIRYERTVHFVDPQGGAHNLTAVRGLPAPLHLGPSFARFSALTLRERVALSRAMLAMMRLGKAGRLALADVSFGQWLDEHHQPASLVEKMYDPILVGSLNEDCRRASAAYAIQVFQDALLANARGYVIGLPACPLSELYAKLPCRDVRPATRVSHIRFQNGKAIGVELSGGEFLPADAVVLATNYHAVMRWVPGELAARDSRFANLDRLESVPILGAHMWFDRPVLSENHAAFIRGPLQWLFKKDADGKAVHGVISAARQWLDVPRDDSLRQFERQIREVFPRAREAKLIRGVTVIEKRATFAPTPGIDRLRPRQAPPPGGIENLYLAGDYTLSGWPATMEGAVRSGYLAAGAIVDAMGTTPFTKAGKSFITPDLPVQWPARLLGL
ncbi:MAG TPA: hydroxysqualene dehydroxylase HpnE [Tepidisphaeraceae bacterium]|nr:hydroxysqualene dehydroxylase HpnE [Tepidisphaeraceae bacterium]